jgi:hypothetical protein
MSQWSECGGVGVGEERLTEGIDGEENMKGMLRRPVSGEREGMEKKIFKKRRRSGVGGRGARELTLRSEEVN